MVGSVRVCGCLWMRWCRLLLVGAMVARDLLRWTTQNFAFFSLFCSHCFVSLSEVLLVELWPRVVAMEHPHCATQNDPRGAQTHHLGGPWRPAATIPREDPPRERKKKRKWEREREKWSTKFRALHHSASPLFLGLHLSNLWVSTPSGPKILDRRRNPIFCRHVETLTQKPFVHRLQC